MNQIVACPFKWCMIAIIWERAQDPARIRCMLSIVYWCTFYGVCFLLLLLNIWHWFFSPLHWKMSWFIFLYFIGYNCFWFWMRYEILKISPCFKRLTLAKYLHLNNYIPSFAMNDKRFKWILKTIFPLLFSSL